MTAFTPFAALAGGALIGLSAVLLMLLEGRIAGISGMAGRLLPPWQAGTGQRLAFILGLIAAPFIVRLVTGAPVLQTVSGHPALMAMAGLLVGSGTALGSGCTSGHGVCGLARLSPRSLAATLTFMAAGFLTVFLTRHVIGG